MQPEDVELPELSVDALAADEEALRRAGFDGVVDAHPVAGVWRQVGGPTDSDFGPGGYERSVLMLNPATRIAALYRSFRGSLAVVMGGELALDAPRDPAHPFAGAIELRTDPSLSSRFPAGRVPLGGTPPRFVEPPAGASPWRLEWTRNGDRLVLGGRVYEPADIAEFERIRRGGGDVATAEERAERTVAPGPGSTAGPTASRPAPKPKQTSFFGVVGGGNRFVYVVDVSGSMMGPKLERLKLELEKSVAMLPDDAEFSIAFFSDGAQVIDQGWMVAQRDRQRAIAAIRLQDCDGGTDPTRALDFAFTTLSPLPDCVFFMTDGLMDPHVVDHVRALNAGRVKTVFHTIGFGEPGAEPVLRQIADENAGTYTYVAP